MSENIGVVSDDVLRATDFLILVDHSGSTGRDSTRLKGKTRYAEIAEDAERIAREAGKFDDDGLTLIHFSGHVASKDGVTADAVADVFNEYKPGGSTNTAGALDAAIDKVRASTKNCVVVIFTDGGADDEDDVVKVLRSAAKEFGRPRVGFIFVRVGDDSGAVAFLDKLDSGLGDDVPDVVACVTAEEAETLSIAHLAYLAQNA